MYKLLMIALGGGAGALCRYGLSTAIQLRSGPGFPWGTLTVNVLGCVGIGLCWGFYQSGERWWSPLLIAGFLGGFTTFSAFALESTELLERGYFGRFSLYLIVSNVLGVLGVLAASRWVRSLLG